MARFNLGQLAVGVGAAFFLQLGVACSGSGGSGDGDGDTGRTGGHAGDGDGDLGDGDRGDGDGDLGDGDLGDGDSDLGGTGGEVGDGDGDTGGTGGQVGDGDGDEPNFILSETNDLYTYTLGTSSMTIDPGDGGRVTSFIVDGQETLVQSGSGPGQYGSVFWPSPQSDWDWPPPAEIDSGTYTSSQSGDRLTLESATNAALGLSVTTTFEPTTTLSGTPAISVSYEIHNEGGSARDVAGWEVSRVSTGTAFYPTGPAGQLGSSSLSVTEMGMHTWYAHGTVDGDKSFGDGADGWLAWVTGSAVVVKSFEDVTQNNFASGEAEIEIYAGGDYFEVEQQGPIHSISAGSSATWNVVWVGVPVPGGTNTAVGSSDLITLVTNAL